ncbi:MAG: hypothetical protein Q9192_003181 [Flavoplaca navasiana]
MPLFINPFRKADFSDFEGVYYPLADYRRRSSANDRSDIKFGELPDEKKLDVSPAPSNGYSAYTIDALQFGPSETQVRYTTCALFIGLCLGASFWGVASNLIGRRLAFNMTLFIAGVFGLP